jgi:hypothetical protein
MATTLFNDLVTFSRGTNATVVGPNGLIQWAPNNLLTSSESFNDTGAWSTYFVTVAANTATAPDGSRTADTLTFASTAIDYHSIFRIVTVAAGLPYTLSVYAKAGTTSVFSMEFRGASAAPDVVYNLANGTVTSGAGTITPVGDGWYRCSITKTTVDTSDTIIFGTGLITTAGTILLWGAQLELGSTATAYNPTTVKNLLGFSEAFDNAGWSKTNASVVAGAQANPINGLFNAQKLMEDTSNGVHRIFQTVGILAAPYTLSFYAKPAGRDWIYIYVNAGFQTAIVNVATGAIGTTFGSPTVTTTPAGNGWYRVALTFPNVTVVSQAIQIWLASNSTTTSYTGDGNSGVYIWGAQLSDSASLDAYVPTPGAAPTSTAYYGPRFDYNPVTLAPRGLLIEEARTNLATFSQDMFNAGYVPINGTRAASTVVGPDGVTNLAQFTSTTTGGNRLQFFQNVTSGVTYTLSVVMSAGTSSFGGLVAAASAGAGAIFSLLGNGSVVSTAGASVTASIQKLSATLYRCSMTFPATATGSCLLGWGVSNGTTYESGVYPSAAAGFVYGSFVQLEAGAFATSYIPTVGSTVLRSADVATLTGSNFSGWYGQSVGTFVADIGRFSSSSTISAAFLSATDNPVNNDWVLLFGDGTGSTFSVFNAGAAQAVLTGSTVSTGGKVAGAYTANDFSFCVNGGTVSTDTTGTPPTDIAVLRLGAFGGNPTFLNGHLRSIAYFNNRLSNAQLQALTELPLITSLSLDFINGVYEG